MTDQLEELVDSLLYEGYALYPYTPGATKNATRRRSGSCTRRLRGRRCRHVRPRAAASASPRRRRTRVLTRDGAVPGRRAASATRPSSTARAAGAVRASASAPTDGVRPAGGSTLRVRAARGDGSAARALRRAQRATGRRRSGLDRAGALRPLAALDPPVLRVAGGRFISPLERRRRRASTRSRCSRASADDVVLGAAIVLPDHPQIAPESRGVAVRLDRDRGGAAAPRAGALSDAERAEIERQDPAVREMIARAAAATPEDIIALHGRVDAAATRGRDEPPERAARPARPAAGEARPIVDGMRFTRGGKVVIRPGPDADIHARMLDGRPRRSSGSSPTTTARPTSASRSTTTPAGADARDRAASVLLCRPRSR